MGSSRNVRRLSALTPSPSHRPPRRRSPLAALPSPPAHFHYPGGIQGVMASRAGDSAGRFNFPRRRPSQVIARESETKKKKKWEQNAGTICNGRFPRVRPPMWKRPVALQTR